jgi:transmembrane sensor
VRREAADWAALLHDRDAEVDRAAFERWRAADPRHAEAYARIERNWSRAGLVEQTSYGRERRFSELRRRRAPLQRRFGLAAAVLAIVVLGAVLVSPYGPFGLWPGPRYSSEVGQIRTVSLPDGSTAVLDTDSAVRLAFDGHERRVSLVRGRARFDVTHDSHRPFVVEAGDGSVVARGTLFDVSLVGDRFEVTLWRGSVDVRREDHHSVSGGRVERLRPGEKIAFTGSQPLPPPALASGAERDWTSGMLGFDRTRLVDVIAQANRYSSAQISLADPTIGDLRVTGAFHARDTAGLARGIAESLHLALAQTSSGNFILSEPAHARPERNS